MGRMQAGAHSRSELREALFPPCDGPDLIYLALFGQDPDELFAEP